MTTATTSCNFTKYFNKGIACPDLIKNPLVSFIDIPLIISGNVKPE